MKEAARALYISLAVAPILPAVGLVIQGEWWAAAALAATAVAWGAARSRYPLADDVGLILFLGGLAYAVWVGAAGGWLLVGACAALAAWDLGHFTDHLATQPTVENEAALWQAHGRQLAFTLAAGMAIGGLSLVTQFPLSFWPAFGLALLAIVAISRLLSN
jgi:hypothetical protein